VSWFTSKSCPGLLLNKFLVTGEDLTGSDVSFYFKCDTINCVSLYQFPIIKFISGLMDMFNHYEVLGIPLRFVARIPPHSPTFPSSFGLPSRPVSTAIFAF